MRILSNKKVDLKEKQQKNWQYFSIDPIEII